MLAAAADPAVRPRQGAAATAAPAAAGPGHREDHGVAAAVVSAAASQDECRGGEAARGAAGAGPRGRGGDPGGVPWVQRVAELPVAAGPDPAAGHGARAERAAADGARDAVHADAGARAGACARQPRGGHGAAQPARRHVQGRQVARRLAGRRHVGRQLAEPGRGGLQDEAEGGGRDEARASPRLRILSPGYESREVAEEKWRRHRRKKWRNFLVITTLLLFMVGYVLYFI